MRNHPANNKQEVINLSIFKEQLYNLLQKIDEFDEDDKEEAISYVRTFIESKTNGLRGPSVTDYKKADPVKKVKPIEQAKSSRIPSHFNCGLCNDTKQTKVALLNHMEICHISTPISCIKCNCTLNSKIAYDWHIQHFCGKGSNLPSSYLKCTDCSQVFKLQRTFNMHVKAHKRNNCTLCDVVLTKRVELIQHMLHVHEIKLKTSTFNCSYCEKGFMKRRSLYYHLQQHHASENICNESSSMGNSKEEFNKDMQLHIQKRKWKCRHCDNQFLERKQYFHHIKIHNQYEGLTCSKKFASNTRDYKKKKHRYSTPGLEPKFNCEHCPAVFTHALLLQRHTLRHKDTKMISCNFCNKFFTTQHQYLKHCRTVNHNRKDPEVMNCICHHCGKIFTRKFKLETHLRWYHASKTKCLRCSHCEYKTYVKANFERHNNLHFTQTYICDHCGKSLSSLAVLMDHIKYNHLQERNLKCDECECSFKRKNELVRHKSSHSNERPHTCQICKHAFKRLNHLHRHEATVHSIAKKTTKVQHLKIDSTGTIVPVPLPEKVRKPKPKKDATNVTVDSIITLYQNYPQPVEYYSITTPTNVNGIVLNNEVLVSSDTLQQLPSSNLQSSRQDNLLLNSVILSDEFQAAIESNCNILSSI